MRDTHGGIGRVHRLSAWTGRAESVDAQVFGLDLDVNFVGFGKHRHRGGRRVDASLLLGGRHALHPMHAALIFQLGINLVALNRGHNFFHSADRGGRAFQNFDFPALRFSIARVHPEKFAGKKRSFIAARARANFYDHVLVVVRVLRQHQVFQFALDGFAPRSQFALFVVRHLLHVRVFRFHQQLLCALQPLFDFLPLAVLGHHRRHIRVRFRELLETRRVVMHFWRGKLLRQLFILRLDMFELFKQRQVRHGGTS